MSDVIQAQYGEIQNQHDALTAAHQAALEAQEACGQAFNAVAPIFVGASGDAAMTAHQHGMRHFDNILTDMKATQQRGMTDVEHLAALDNHLAGGLSL
jgi:hypothetical protein